MVSVRAAVEASLLVVWLLLCLSSRPSEANEPVLTPLSLVASLDPDRLYIFNCIANGSGVPTAEIDGLLFNHQTILAKGITVTLVSDENVLHNSTVRIPATIENNDTSIQCLFFGDSGRQESAIGTFFVQGLLEAPSTQLVAVNSSHLSFSWTPPFSLDITDSTPDIQFYSFYETLSPSSTNQSEPQTLVFPVLAVQVEFSVSAWNIVGEGATTTTTHQPCSISLEQQTVNTSDVKSEVIYSENEGGILSLSLPWPLDCFPLFSLELQEEGGGGGGEEVVVHNRLIPRVLTDSGGEREVHLSVPLQGRDNAHYSALLSSTSSERAAVPALDKLRYSTHDVQLVKIDFTATSITANCWFAVGSQALGCFVHISSPDDDTTVQMLSVMRESDDKEEGLPLSAVGTAEGLEAGVYRVTVYDIESNGETSSDGVPAHTEDVDITQPTTQPPTTSPSPDTTNTPPPVITDPLSPERNSQSNNAVPIIAGAVIAGVLIVSLVLLILASGIVWRNRKRRERKAEEAESREREFVLISTGEAISSESMATPYLNPAHTLQVSSSSSPSHTLPGSASSLQRNSLSKDTLPPAYSELSQTKSSHIRSMSDDVVATNNTRSSAGPGGVASQEGLATANGVTKANSQKEITMTQKKAVEMTLSAPPTSPPPSIPKTSTMSASPKATSHTHLINHERSASLGGPYPPPSSSVPPPHPPKKMNHRRHRAPPAPSFSTPALLPPHNTSSPLSLPSFFLTSEDTPPGGREVLSLGDETSAVGKNPLYDTTAALQLKAEEKRRSVQYVEVVARSQAVATPPSSDSAHPRDTEVVLYSEVNVNELVPRLPTKRAHTTTSSQPMESATTSTH